MLYSSFNLVKFWLQPLRDRELDKKIYGYVLLKQLALLLNMVKTLNKDVSTTTINSCEPKVEGSYCSKYTVILRVYLNMVISSTELCLRAQSPTHLLFFSSALRKQEVFQFSNLGES